MADIHIVCDYPHPPATVWRAVTDSDLIPLWTATGQGGRPVGFTAVPGTRFQFVAKPVPGWRGIVDCEVLEVREPSLVRYSWASPPSSTTWTTPGRCAPTAPSALKPRPYVQPG
jgi:uncharacterized protein YndB with AHSA1/START domain